MTPTPLEIRRLVRWGGPLLGFVAAFGLLVDLAGLSLRQWDEARLAVSAIEMVKSGNWWVTTFGFKPDLWNTKPPLMIWLQAGLIQLLGPTEWAVRLPAALAALATVGLLHWFMTNFLRRPMAGLLAGSVLISALGFLGEHHGHSGDYDALLTLAQLAMGLSLLILLETGHSRWWVGIGVGLIIATLTKGVAALLPLPAVCLYCLAHRRGRNLLRTLGFWLVLLIWSTVIAAWYILREHIGPGYWHSVNINELGGRFGTALEAHVTSWHYYFALMFHSKLLPWVYLLPLVIPFAVRHPDARARRVAWFALSWAAGLLFVLSIAKTRIEWYAIPAYPWLAVLVGLGAPRLATQLLGQAQIGAVRTSLRVLLTALIVLPPLLTIRHELRGNWRDTIPFVRAGYGLRELQHEPHSPTPLAVVAPARFYTSLRPPTAVGGDSGYNASLRFYVLAYPRPIRVVSLAAVAALHAPGYVLTSNPVDSAKVHSTFPQAAHRAVGRHTCWLWTLPTQ